MIAIDDADTIESNAFSKKEYTKLPFEYSNADRSSGRASALLARFAQQTSLISELSTPFGESRPAGTRSRVAVSQFSYARVQ